MLKQHKNVEQKQNQTSYLQDKSARTTKETQLQLNRGNEERILLFYLSSSRIRKMQDFLLKTQEELAQNPCFKTISLQVSRVLMQHKKAANMQPQPWTLIIIFQDKTLGLKYPQTYQEQKKKIAQINKWKMSKT